MTTNTATTNSVAAPLTPEEANVVQDAIKPGVVVRPVATEENLEHAKRDEGVATAHKNEAQAILNSRIQARDEFWTSNNATYKGLRERIVTALTELQEHQAKANATESSLTQDIEASSYNVTQKTAIAESTAKVRNALELSLQAQHIDEVKASQLAEYKAQQAAEEAHIRELQEKLASLRQNASKVEEQADQIKKQASKAQAELAQDPNVAKLLNVDPTQVILDKEGVLQVRDDAAAKKAALNEEAERRTDELLRDADALGKVLGQAEDAGNKAAAAQGVLEKATPVVPANPDAATFVDVAADGSIHQVETAGDVPAAEVL
jgi:chromosome segregation ATPase